MLADWYTKPLQGNLFRILWDVVMEPKHASTLKRPPMSANQERVGNNMNLESNNSRNILEDEYIDSDVDGKTARKEKGGSTDISTRRTHHVHE
mmetsp:Transcript_12818/g.12430  ORF Transcript_12818/g.12430 Transcript_12818/m.12430 type:complete len:93 (+) Transcript_12818:111-389(+)|eukprot:CAMPEP_0197840844 /NCGR_PEP_ID=MMETSP1437-20131217/45839_1 /TAXON_ID=49252 ORGANISM="Eucampia antarctica, Strain CCMP1452" /NCGR_SAMPLE_ID=MMETSP1437 /ASSEMBLY_ACC=CAM_ASM_001096 /LENGTH=92 /DNA_ID=CAMNT_0043450511 /DNA_START=69 /DNA_END=347 /DNA_ORIENTATION=+